MTHGSKRTPGPRPRTFSIGGATFDVFMKTGASAMHECDGKRMLALPLGGKIRVAEVIGACGGGANNTSVALARLGCDAAFGGVLGDDQWGENIEATLEKEGVDVRHATVIEGEPSSFSVILLAEGGERTILTHKSMDRHFHDVTFDREAVRKADAVYLNHMHEDSCAIEDDLLALMSEPDAPHLTWNPGGHTIEEGLTLKSNRLLASHTDLMLLNKEEALAFCATKTVKQALHLLIEAGVRIACVTDGANGCVATDGISLFSCPAPHCEVTDSTGAGDAFGAAATRALLSGKDLPTALKAGTINAMSVVGSIGAQKGLLTHTRIQTELTGTNIAVTVEPF